MRAYLLLCWKERNAPEIVQNFLTMTETRVALAAWLRSGGAAEAVVYNPQEVHSVALLSGRGNLLSGEIITIEL